MTNRTCATPNCPTDAAGLGKYCAEHSPHRARAMSPTERILARTDRGPDHWLWTGHVNKSGVGTLRYRDEGIYAHRHLYELEHGPIPARRRLVRTCDVERCVRPEHHQVHEPLPQGVSHPPTAERFAAKVRKAGPGECWEWIAGRNNRGYGTFYVSADQRHAYAHRFSYELHIGPIPDGVEVDHICHTRPCVNPDHLRLASHRLNSQNRSGPQVNNQSGHLGVYFETRGQQWVAQVKHRGRVVIAKRFSNKEDAVVAAIEGRNQYFDYNDRDRM